MQADLGIGARVPVMQSGMRGVAGPDLAAAVSNAGGVGVLAVLGLKPDVVREQIHARDRRIAGDSQRVPGPV